jgi:hypothetical protein
MNTNKYERGEAVMVTTFDRGIVERVVVEDRPDCVVISTRDGLAALDRGEDAPVLGFPRRDVARAA